MGLLEEEDYVNAPPWAAREIRRYCTISEAVGFAFAEAEAGRAKNFSIIICEGTYVDELQLFKTDELPSGFALEFWGVGQTSTKIVNIRKLLYVNNGVHITLKNLSIEDLHEEADQIFFPITAMTKAQVELINVRFSMKQQSVGAGIAAIGKGARISLVNCRLSLCPVGVFAKDGAKVALTNSVLEDNSLGHCKLEGSSLQAIKTKFLKGGIKLENKSSAAFTDCQLEGSWDQSQGSWNPSQGHLDPSEGEKQNALLVIGSSITLKNSTITKSSVALILRQSGTKAHVEDCTITDVFCAFYAMFNVDAEFSRNRLQCHTVLVVQNNAEGKVELRGNRVSGGRPRIELDESSKLFFHDFEPEAVRFNVIKPRSRPSDKEKSKFMKERHAQAKSEGAEAARMVQCDIESADKTKRCERCGKEEKDSFALAEVAVALEEAGAHGVDESTEEVSLKHCSRCRTVCYCSSKCQRKDWKDHKLVCRHYATEDTF